MASEDPARPATDGDTTTGSDGGDAGGVVTRTVEVDAAPADVWEAVADPAERALWLDDPDALARHLRVEESLPGHRLVWTWWRPGDEGDASTVSVVLTPGDAGGTRVVVTESLPAPSPLGGASASAAADAAPAGRPAPAAGGAARANRLATRGARPTPAFLRCAGDRWDGRLLGLEVLFVAARVPVA